MLLGIDIGTTNIKAGLYGRGGEVLAHCQSPTPREAAADGRDYYLPDRLWQETATLIRNIAEHHPVEALAISAMGESGVTLDDKGEAIFPVIPWNDHRAEDQMAAMAARLPASRWYAITGLHPNPIHSIAKWVWLQENEPDVWRRTRHWLSLTDFARFKLTGEIFMEASQAARTMAYDVWQNRWSDELLDLASIPRNILPELLTGTDPAGTVTPEAAGATGLKAGTPVFAGGHDHICAALACGALQPGVALDSLGTAEALTLGLPGNWPQNRTGGFGVGPHVVPDHKYLLGGIYSSGGSLAWVKSLLGIDSYDALFEQAAAVEPGTSPLFKAHFFGEAPPFQNVNAKGGFIDVLPSHKPAHFVRAVLEGVVFELKRHIDVFEDLTGEPTNIIRVVGSAARNDLWPKIRAAILGRPLELSHNEDMVTQGAALLAGIGVGLYNSPQDAIAATRKPGRIIEPDPEWQQHYQKPYRRYCEISRILNRT